MYENILVLIVCWNYISMYHQPLPALLQDIYLVWSNIDCRCHFPVKVEDKVFECSSVFSFCCCFFLTLVLLQHPSFGKIIRI